MDDLVRRKRFERGHNDGVDLAGGHDPDECLEALAAKRVAEGTDVLTDGDEAMAIFVDPTSNPLCLRKTGFAFLWVRGFPDVPHHTHRDAPFVATPSLAPAPTVVKDAAGYG